MFDLLLGLHQHCGGWAGMGRDGSGPGHPRGQCQGRLHDADRACCPSLGCLTAVVIRIHFRSTLADAGVTSCGRVAVLRAPRGCGDVVFTQVAGAQAARSVTAPDAAKTPLTDGPLPAGWGLAEASLQVERVVLAEQSRGPAGLASGGKISARVTHPERSEAPWPRRGRVHAGRRGGCSSP